MDSIEPSYSRPLEYDVFVMPQVQELPHRNHTVLLGREVLQRSI